MGVGNDIEVFVSSAAGDDAADPRLRGDVGWVSEFRKALEYALARRLGRRPKILSPGCGGEDTSRVGDPLDSVRQAAVFVYVLTPSYTNSPECVRQLEAFLEREDIQAGAGDGAEPESLFRVSSIPLLSEPEPAVYRGRPYRFHDADAPAGTSKEYLPTEGDYRFWNGVIRLAGDIATRLSQVAPASLPARSPTRPPGPMPGTEGTVVYLAQTTDDLEEEYDRLAKELRDRGVQVLPPSTLPTRLQSLEQTVEEHLSRATHYVHLLGRHFGAKPVDEERSISWIQYDLAKQHSQNGGAGMPRLCWISPAASENGASERQRRFLQHVQEETEAPPASQPLSVFISYAEEDEPYREALDKHLGILKRLNLIEAWSDRRISPGQEWSEAIDENLEKAHIILLLISVDFINSDYCWGVELERAMARHEAKEARVIPVFVRPVDWTGAPFGKLQALPDRAEPVQKWESEDEALAKVASGIRTVVDELLGAASEGVRTPERLDVLQGEFDTFSETVLRKVCPTTRRRASARSNLVFLLKHPADADAPALAELLDCLRRNHFDVFESSDAGDERSRERHAKSHFSNGDGLLIYCGDAPVTWVQSRALDAREASERRRKKPLVAAVFNGPPPSKSENLGIYSDIVSVVDCRQGLEVERLERFFTRVAGRL